MFWRTTKSPLAERYTRHALSLERDIPEPIFNVQLGLTRDYDCLFQKEYSKEVSVLDALAECTHGRLLLVGRGGAAKTVSLKRLAYQLAKEGDVPVMVYLHAWSAANYSDWKKTRSGAQKIDYLLQHFSPTPTRSIELDLLPNSIQRVLFIDGLNEVASWVGQEIIYAVDDFIRYNRSSNAILTDRLIRREFDSEERWQLAAILPLTEQEIRQHVNGSAYEPLSNEIKVRLRNPLHLQSYRAGNQTGAVDVTNSASFLEKFRKAGLSDAEIDATAFAAFEAYRVSARSFPATKFAEDISIGVWTKLTRSTPGLVTVDPNDPELAYFSHHLNHDFLAAKYVSGRPELWNRDCFDQITFWNSSFDSLAMCLEQIHEPARADEFLRSVYDWNFYGAGYALAESGRIRASREMQLIILAMFAERREDLMLATAKRAEDTLSLIDSADANALRETETIDEIFAFLKSVATEHAEFIEWRRLFVRPAGSAPEPADFDRLCNPDSVTGWSTSNILKRLVLTPEHQAQVRGLLAHNADVVRWRAAHVLGAFPNRANIAALAECLGDNDRHVKYGSMRSLVEIAIKESALAREVFDRLTGHADMIASDPRFTTEFHRSIIPRKEILSGEWQVTVFPIVQLLESKAKTDDQSEQWIRLLRSMSVIYQD